ncbi:MAG: translation initiation factor [Deltaproteobacteria bacterium]|nr:translation initiation factor [Deltaproteobacteria bacterium]
MNRSPFASLESLRVELPSGPERAAPSVPSAPAVPRCVVRYERKGRGGKEATVVERLGLGAPELQRWCGELKKALGCGGGVEGESLVFQGDQRERLRTLLEARGVRRVTVS